MCSTRAEVRSSVGRQVPAGWSVDAGSYWSALPTEFPALRAHLPDREPRWRERSACVIGAADGKFVLPLLEKGWLVTALDISPTFLFGGEISLRDGPVEIVGLRRRLDEWAGGDAAALAACSVVEANYMEWTPPAPFDLVILSGVWSMDQNRVHSLRDLIWRSQEYVAAGGILFADYMAPATPEERAQGYCPEVTEVESMFANGWTILDSRDLGMSMEERHFGWEEWHSHRYAVLIARKRDL